MQETHHYTIINVHFSIKKKNKTYSRLLLLAKRVLCFAGISIWIRVGITRTITRHGGGLEIWKIQVHEIGVSQISIFQSRDRSPKFASSPRRDWTSALVWPHLVNATIFFLSSLWLYAPAAKSNSKSPMASRNTETNAQLSDQSQSLSLRKKLEGFPSTTCYPEIQKKNRDGNNLHRLKKISMGMDVEPDILQDSVPPSPAFVPPPTTSGRIRQFPARYQDYLPNSGTHLPHMPIDSAGLSHFPSDSLTSTCYSPASGTCTSWNPDRHKWIWAFPSLCHTPHCRPWWKHILGRCLWQSWTCDYSKSNPRSVVDPIWRTRHIYCRNVSESFHSIQKCHCIHSVWWTGTTLDLVNCLSDSLTPS